VLAQRQQFHQSRLIEHAAPSDLGYQQTIETMTRFFQAQGSSASDAASQAIALVGQTLQRQIDLLAYRRVLDAIDHWSLDDPARADHQADRSHGAAEGPLKRGYGEGEVVALEMCRVDRKHPRMRDRLGS
jgi:hypothetical protein